MMKMLLLVGMACLCISFALAEAPEKKQAPDFASMDKDVLVVMCNQFWNRIILLEEKITSLEQRIGAGVGAVDGTGVAVDGETTVIENGSWAIKIVDNSEPDIKPLQYKIQVERNKLPDIDTRLQQANVALSNLVSKGPYHAKMNRYGYRTKAKFDLSRKVQKVER